MAIPATLEVSESILDTAISYAAGKLGLSNLNAKQEAAVRGFLKRKDVFVFADWIW